MDYNFVRGSLIPVLLFGRPLSGLEQVEIRGKWHVFLYEKYIGCAADNGLHVYCNYLDSLRILADELESLIRLRELGNLSDSDLIRFSLGMMRGTM